MAHAKKSKIDPFKTRKSRETNGKNNDTLAPPREISEAIDSFREAQEQAKHYEGEATIYKDTILNFGFQEFAKRVGNGYLKSFKILGENAMVNFVVQDSSAGLTEEDAANFEEKWGEKAAAELIVKDFGSIKFDAKVLEANYDEVISALQALPESILSQLFKPMLMKAKPGAVEACRKFAKSPEELEEIVQDLRIKAYIK